MQDKSPSLTPDVYHIVCEQGTEQPNTGQYNLTDRRGTYLCRRCGLALFRSEQKFISSCGWPSFDDEIPERVRRLADPDRRRTEIRCQRCDAHLGHAFTGEQFTEKNLRHCVNSASIDFVDNLEVIDSEEAIFAAGCFGVCNNFLINCQAYYSLRLATLEEKRIIQAMNLFAMVRQPISRQFV